MPRATIDPAATERHELKTLEGGYVVIRRMAYGKYLDRQSEMMEMKVRRDEGGQDEGLMKMMGRQTTVIEFKECIVEHNLEDADGNVLNFGDPRTLDVLDPRIGQEIGDLLRKINTFEEDLGN